MKLLENIQKRHFNIATVVPLWTCRCERHRGCGARLQLEHRQPLFMFSLFCLECLEHAVSGAWSLKAMASLHSDVPFQALHYQDAPMPLDPPATRRTVSFSRFPFSNSPIRCQPRDPTGCTSKPSCFLSTLKHLQIFALFCKSNLERAKAAASESQYPTLDVKSVHLFVSRSSITA